MRSACQNIKILHLRINYENIGSFVRTIILKDLSVFLVHQYMLQLMTTKYEGFLKVFNF